MIQSRTAALLARPALFLGLASAAAAQDAPFQDPALRWIRPAPVADAWIPTAVGFAGDDELCWSLGRGATTRVGLDATASSGLAVPLFGDTFDVPLAGALDVATTRSRDGLFVLSQTHAGDPSARDIHLARYDSVAAARGADFAPGWQLDMNIQADLTARFVVDGAGERGALLLADTSLDRLYLRDVDLATGVVLQDVSFDGGVLDAAAMSRDGRRLAIVTGNRVRVFDEAFVPIFDQPLFSATPAIAFDADGSRLVVGGFGQVRVFDETGGSYAESLVLGAASGELAKRVDLSDDGGVVAVGWWNHLTGVDARLEVFEGTNGTTLREVSFPGTPGGLQNSPSALEVSGDGARVAFGAWGDGDDDPEVLLIDLALDEPLIAVDLPGSVMDLDLDESGTRLLVAAKHLHANQVGSTGELRLYDTGERDLELVQPARPGGVLHLAARAEGSNAAWFLIGAERATPFANGLALDRRGLRVMPATVKDGGAELALPLPAGPRLPGLELSIQAALRGPNGLSFSETVLRPSFL